MTAVAKINHHFHALFGSHGHVTLSVGFFSLLKTAINPDLFLHRLIIDCGDEERMANCAGPNSVAPTIKNEDGSGPRAERGAHGRPWWGAWPVT